MALGSYDANGIWHYGESDNIALFSDTLNKLADSTTSAFTADRSRISTLEASNLSGMIPVKPAFITAVTGTASINTLGTITFSGCTGLYVGQIFNNDYKRYVISIATTSTTTTNVFFRFMKDGTTYSANYYGGSVLVPYSGSISTDQQKSGGTEASIGLSGLGSTAHKLDIYPSAINPQYSFTAVSAANANSYFGGYNVTGSLTGINGFYIYISSGTFNGQINVYGLND